MPEKPNTNRRVKPGVCERCGRSFMAFRASLARFCSKSCSARGQVPPVADRLAAKTDRNGPTPSHRSEYGNCWLWGGETASDGYGRLHDEGKRVPAHVAAWQVSDGAPVPAGRKIMHVCDVKNCVRNDDAGTYTVGGETIRRWGHLALGTPLLNMLDASEKGRSSAAAYRRAATKPESYPRGEQHARSKLTTEQVLAIKALRGQLPAAKVALQFSISKAAIKAIWAGLTWRHV